MKDLKIGDEVVVYAGHKLFDLFVGAMGVVKEVDPRPETADLILVAFQEANGGRGVWIWDCDLEAPTVLDWLAAL